MPSPPVGRSCSTETPVAHTPAARPAPAARTIEAATAVERSAARTCNLTSNRSAKAGEAALAPTKIIALSAPSHRRFREMKLHACAFGRHQQRFRRLQLPQDRIGLLEVVQLRRHVLRQRPNRLESF